MLEVEDLHVHFATSRGTVRAVEGLSFEVDRGEVVAIVGESGSGKSVSALSIMRLLPRLTGRIPQGRIMFDGRNLLELDDEEMREIRGRDISMIFQEPMTSLNPILTIGLQITEPLTIHLGMNDAQARARAVELLRLVGIPDAERRLDQYPHQFSGGMRQRVMIAIGLACNPKLIIADEPTTALDVTIQAQILELMKDLSRKLNIALIIITHNLGVVARYADRVIVMYAGAHGRAGRGRRGVPPAAPSLHDGAAALGAAARPAARRQARDHRRPAAQPRQCAAGLPLRAALPVPDRDLRRRSRRSIRPTPAALSRCHRHAEIAAGKIAWAAQRRRRADRRRASRRAAAGGAQSDQAFPGARRLARPRRHWCARSRTSASTSIPARRSAWSANPAAARPRSAA